MNLKSLKLYIHTGEERSIATNGNVIAVGADCFKIGLISQFLRFCFTQNRAHLTIFSDWDEDAKGNGLDREKDEPIGE